LLKEKLSVVAREEEKIRDQCGRNFIAVTEGICVFKLLEILRKFKLNSSLPFC